MTTYPGERSEIQPATTPTEPQLVTQQQLAARRLALTEVWRWLMQGANHLPLITPDEDSLSQQHGENVQHAD